MKRFSIIAVALLLGGCASFVAEGPAFDEKLLKTSDSATFFVYRPEHFFFAGRIPNLFIDEIDRGKLRDGGYMSVDVQPGTHTLTLHGDIFWWPFPAIIAKVNISPNQKYFLRLSMSRDGGAAAAAAAAAFAAAAVVISPIFLGGLGGISASYSDQYSLDVVQEEIGRMEILNTKLSK
jgi:hypothetical protein